MRARTRPPGAPDSAQLSLFAPPVPPPSPQIGLFETHPEEEAVSPPLARSAQHSPRGPRPARRTTRSLDRVPVQDFSRVPGPPPGVCFGTSSWTYPGWKGTIYDRTFRESGDAMAMLEQYVCCPLFSCVGVDSTFYRPPSRATLQHYREILPPGFEACGKVYDLFTIQRFGQDRKWGERAGRRNADFLHAARCTDEVVGPWLEELKDRAGPLIFEFQTMHRPDAPQPGEWADWLEAFFSALPQAGRYAVELRNAELLGSEYLAALRRVGVAHCFNSWTRMPPIGEQLELPGALTARFTVARVLLQSGRTYEQAVDRFQPYDRVQDVQEEVRWDVVRLIEEALEEHVRVYVLVNNRLEGHAPGTIQAIREMLAGRSSVPPNRSES